MIHRLAQWWRQLRASPAAPAAASPATPAAADYARVRYEAADGRPLPTAEGAARRIGYRPLPDGGLETETWELAPPEWLSTRTREQPDAQGLLSYRRTQYYPWGQERRRVALQHPPAGPPIVDYHEYFPTGELQRHRRLAEGALGTVFGLEPWVPSDPYTEEMPQFPGGMEQLMQDLTRYLKYPRQALISGQEGRILVSFTLGPDGVMRDFTAPPEAPPVLARAAIEVLEQVAQRRRWRPGFQKRRAVSVSYSVPVTFTIR
ncbi:hypothetical protein EJV47_24265 [Hymenobacter gummosus]|uniref:TonB C-terminal domain-containing protein n=1 Tax=Hymenobacter gummosus TaxID=1776032 RepID=A0A431TW80_9BACT|nr:energy transducer TonB [Hymenobacter gummosus]RTQ45609.1 hypothetical protein EJV47_24265 [Hymenobacter gummosus]